MSIKRTPPEEPLRQLTENLADDLMTTSDKEIVEEVRAQGADPAAAAARIRGLVAEALARSRKGRLAAARTELLAARASQQTNGPTIDPQRAREILERAAANDPELQQRLTLAARNGQALSDRDIQTLVEDLQALGVLKEQDKEKP